MRTVLLLTDRYGKKTVYPNALIMLTDPDSELQVHPGYFKTLIKEQGWPVRFQGNTVEKIPMISAADVKKKE